MESRILDFLSYGWPNVASPFHKPLLSPPVPYRAFVAQWLDHLYGHYRASAVAVRVGEKQLPENLTRAMLKWGLGHRIRLLSFSEAVPQYREFLTHWDKEWFSKIAPPQASSFGDDYQLDAREFGSESATIEEIVGRAAVGYMWYTRNENKGLQKLFC